MGGSGSWKKKPKAPPAPALKAQGSGKKRTPQTAFDPAAGEDVYEPELIVAERLTKGVTQYHVKWAGFETKQNTWEPLEHLATRTSTSSCGGSSRRPSGRRWRS